MGTVAVPLDGLSASGRYRYGDAVLLLHLPDHGPFPYDAYDLTGAVATPGSYAFFEAPDDVGPVITTYEGLRQDAAVLRIHASDADGVSRANLYGAVATGDLFEWKQAEDCFVRYRVTDAPAADGTAPYREFAVRPETYAFQSCQSGDLPAEAPPVAFTTAPDLPLDHLGGTRLTGFAVVHGPWQLVPEGWAGATEESTWRQPPAQSITMYPDEPEGIYVTDDLSSARRDLPYWRDPSVPAGMRFYFAESGAPDGPAYGYCATWGRADRYGPAITICGYYSDWRGMTQDASFGSGRGAVETRTIAGRPALIRYSPPGPNHSPGFPDKLWIYDPATEVEYEIAVSHSSYDVIAIAQSLFESPNAP